MRRVFRILLNALTVLSLALFVATVVLWVRSPWFGDGVTVSTLRHRSGGEVFTASGINSTHDGVMIHRVSDMKNEPWEPFFDAGEPARMRGAFGMWKFTSWRLEGRPWRGTSFWNRLGFETRELRFPPPNGPLRGGYWTVPHWAIAGVAAVIPAWRFVRRVRRKRRRVGLCPSCGYDLRATPERCPECGEPTAPVGVG